MKIKLYWATKFYRISFVLFSAVIAAGFTFGMFYTENFKEMLFPVILACIVHFFLVFAFSRSYACLDLLNREFTITENFGFIKKRVPLENIEKFGTTYENSDAKRFYTIDVYLKDGNRLTFDFWSRYMRINRGGYSYYERCIKRAKCFISECNEALGNF